MSGVEVVRVASDELEVEVLPGLGGRIHRIRSRGLDLLRTPPDPAVHEGSPLHWGSYPLVPWCNRFWGGRIEWDGPTIEVPVNWDGGTTAIHGEAFARPWVHHGNATMTFRGGGHGFPVPYLAAQSFAVDGPTLIYTLAVTDVGEVAMPAGLGIHPWFTATRITLDAERWSPTIEDARDGTTVAVSGPSDLRDGADRRWGWDAVWTGLGRRAVELGWPEQGCTATLGFTPSAPYVTVATIEEVGAMAVEPQTMQVGRPDRLEPGETLAVTYSLTVVHDR